jgi:hypothetical protein
MPTGCHCQWSYPQGDPPAGCSCCNCWLNKCRLIHCHHCCCWRCRKYWIPIVNQILLCCKEVWNDRQIKYSGTIVFAAATVD